MLTNALITPELEFEYTGVQYTVKYAASKGANAGKWMCIPTANAKGSSKGVLFFSAEDIMQNCFADEVSAQ